MLIEGPGGHVVGTGASSAQQNSVVNFIPSMTGTSAPPLVSPYPAGQGLATINSAYPASAAYLPSTYATATSATSSPSLTTLLLLAGLAAGAWLLLRKRR
jgi:hypothetical protein